MDERNSGPPPEKRAAAWKEGKHLNRTIRLVLIVLLSLVFVGSGAMILRQMTAYQEGEELYNEAAELVELPDFSLLEQEEVLPAQSSGAEGPTSEKPQIVYVDPYADLLKNMDFSALREVNSDVQGWIVIPGTAISYPLLQGADNDYYLNHTYKKTLSVVGAIFLDSRCGAGLTDFNTIIYGHRMNNGSMFAGLKHYKKQSYWQNHSKVYVTTDEGTFTYRIFSAYEGSASGESYRLSFSSDEKKQDFIDTVCASSVIETGTTPTVNDYVLTLSTCTGNGHANRWIVHAMREGPEVEETPQDPVGQPDSGGAAAQGPDTGSPEVVSPPDASRPETEPGENQPENVPASTDEPLPEGTSSSMGDMPEQESGEGGEQGGTPAPGGSASGPESGGEAAE